MEMTLTASILTRLSKKASAANLSLDGGLQDSRQVAAELRAKVVAERIDNGVSGKIRLRKGLQAWLEDAMTGHADILIAPHSDRITRTGLSSQSGQIMDMLKGLDPDSGKQVRPPIRLVTVSSSDGGRIDTSLPGGLEKLEQEFAAAAVELRRITQRNKQTRKRMVAAGRYTGSGAPLGTKVVLDDRGNKVLTRDDSEAGKLEESASQLIRKDAWGAVVRAANESGLRTRRGNLLTRSSLERTLTSEASKQFVFDPATWRVLQTEIARRKSGPSQAGRPSAFLLTEGNGECVGCSTRLTASRGRYKCNDHTMTCPTRVSIDAVQTDAFVEAEFLARYGDDPESDILITIVGGEDIETAQAAVEASQAELLANPTAKTAKAYATAQATLAKLENEPKRREPTIRLTGRTLAETWTASDLRGRRAMLWEYLAEPVKITPGPARGRAVDTSRIDLTWTGDVVGDPERGY